MTRCKKCKAIPHFDGSQWFDCSADYMYFGNVRLLSTMPKASLQENLHMSSWVILLPFGLSSVVGKTESDDMTQNSFIVSKVIVKKSR